jgi:hypothetical protein
MSDNEKMEMSEDDIEIIDFQSDDRSGSQRQSNIKPVPTGIKLLLGGISVALLIGMASLYVSKGNNYSIDNDADLVQIDGESDDTAGTNELIAILDKSKILAQSPQKAVLTIGPVTEQEKITERVVSMELQIQQMTQQIDTLSGQGKTIKQLNTQVGQIAEHLETLPTQNDLADMRQDFNEMLQTAKDELKNSLVKTYKKAKSYVSKKKIVKTQRMPFKLVSIDQWNSVDYAAIQSKNIGAIENLRKGDTRSGWKVERIDVVESSVVFKHIKTGRSIKQTAI